MSFLPLRKSNFFQNKYLYRGQLVIQFSFTFREASEEKNFMEKHVKHLRHGFWHLNLYLYYIKLKFARSCSLNISIHNCMVKKKKRNKWSRREYPCQLVALTKKKKWPWTKNTGLSIPFTLGETYFSHRYNSKRYPFKWPRLTSRAGNWIADHNEWPNRIQ